MATKKNITIDGELTIRNAEAVKTKLISESAKKSKVSLSLNGISEIDFSGVQLLISAQLSNYIEAITMNKMHPEMEKLLVSTGIDSIIKKVK